MSNQDMAIRVMVFLSTPRRHLASPVSVRTSWCELALTGSGSDRPRAALPQNSGTMLLSIMASEALRQHVDKSHGGRTPLDAGTCQNRCHGEVPTQTRQQGSERFYCGRQTLGASCPSSIRKPLHRGSVGRSGAGLHLRDEFIDQALYLRGHEGTLAAVIVDPEPSL
ncbi:hypothetical protein ACIRP3_31870 [Streptomyces sp. NPDC101209]|uniref:hypothetical protein n=1 Tax=Streptomyces sp. NPDC101209 TaxID=3366129 RepID=UPI0037F83253